MAVDCKLIVAEMNLEKLMFSGLDLALVEESLLICTCIPTDLVIYGTILK